MSQNHSSLFPDQVVPLSLTILTFLLMSSLLFSEVFLLNHFLWIHPIHLRWQLGDILIGVTIYLKTSIDFAIFIGRLMAKFPGWKNRVMIEVGTALGNAIGTMLIIILWDVFREIKPLMAVMVFVASLVLFRLAEEGLEHVKDAEGKYIFSFYGAAEKFEQYLHALNAFFSPVLNKVVPRLSVNDDIRHGLRALFWLSISIPFLLGLDDFAGYFPLFNVVNVYGFAVGVFFGHMVLNMFLFLSPRRTISIVKHPVISFFGSLFFVGLGLLGIAEALQLIVP